MLKNSIHYKHCFDTLRKSELFSNVDKDTLDDMLELCQYETRDKGATAISQYQANDFFYLIISGSAKVSVYNPRNGREHIMFLLGSGDTFDLIGLLDSEWNDAFATALENMEILSTTVKQARSWVEQHPKFNSALLPYLGKQIHALANQTTDLSLYDTEARLSRLILRNLPPSKLTGDSRLLNDLSQETLAAMVGSVRVVITRHLQRWKKESILSGKRGKWSILDLQALLEKAQK